MCRTSQGVIVQILYLIALAKMTMIYKKQCSTFFNQLSDACVT
jgi:hypothetical protein